MSKLKIQGNTSGTGVITLVAPNTNTDRTVTLPDESITLAGGVDGIVSTANATAITIDSSENVGIGVTPPAYGAGYTGVSVGAVGTILADTSGLDGMYLASNAYYGAGYKYIQNGKALELKMDASGGNFKFRTAASGTAGGAITWSDRLEIKADGRGLSQFTAKAWVNFNGTGTPSIRDSHNISSLTDNGTGIYTVNFTNNTANANYSVSALPAWNTGSTSFTFSVFVDESTLPTTSAIKLGTKRSDGTSTDKPYVALQVFGD